MRTIASALCLSLIILAIGVLRTVGTTHADISAKDLYTKLIISIPIALLLIKVVMPRINRWLLRRSTLNNTPEKI